MWVRVVVPVTSLCPCSKKISERGAHNQRSHVTIEAKLREDMWIEELIEIAESEASCELYGILKRPDEKYVTERAYDNPKFVEDMVRDVAVRLNNEPRVAAYVVESENFESIHNHSAYALIERDKDADPDRPDLRLAAAGSAEPSFASPMPAACAAGSACGFLAAAETHAHVPRGTAAWCLARGRETTGPARVRHSVSRAPPPPLPPTAVVHHRGGKRAIEIVEQHPGAPVTHRRDRAPPCVSEPFALDRFEQRNLARPVHRTPGRARLTGISRECRHTARPGRALAMHS